MSIILSHYLEAMIQIPIFRSLEKDELKHIEKDSTQYLKFEHSIRLENISFAYPNRIESPILNNFSLEVKKNASLGIVGKSGSGKSTLRI